MKNIFKTMLPILAMAACVWASCSDDKDDPTPGKPALPTIAVSEPALSADNAKAVVTVTPSEETEKCHRNGIYLSGKRKSASERFVRFYRSYRLFRSQKSCFHDNMVFLLSNVIAVFTVANIAEISATGY